MNQHIIQQLQASHQILHWIERAKSSSEDVIDELPVAIAIVEKSGKVRRGNLQLAKLLGVDFEDLIDTQIQTSFTSENWSILKSNIDHALEQEDTSEFELEALKGGDRTPTMHSWSIRKFSGKNSQELTIVFGLDISKRKQTERKLSQIYSNIPLGILQLGKNLEILSPYSAYAEVLLGRGLEGKNIFNVLFKPAWESLSIVQQEALRNLPSVIGGEDFQFDLVRYNLPTKLSLPASNGLEERKLGMTMGAIVQDEKVTGFFLLLDNRTEIEKKNKEEGWRQSEEVLARRYVEVKRLSVELARSTLSDLFQYYSQIDDDLKEEEPTSLLRTLHGIKGTARIGGLSQLSELAHKVEEEFFIDRETGALVENWKSQLGKLQHLLEEWKEIQTLFQIIQPETFKEVQLAKTMTSEMALAQLTQRLKYTVISTAQSLQKDVRFEIDWGKESFPQKVLKNISECLLHIITNAIDHGIEMPEARSSVGKHPQGVIKIHASCENNETVVRVSDDGKGIDAERVAQAAVKKGLMTQEQIAKLSQAEARNLIFLPGFSTTQSASLFSGRGIGLDAVAASVKKMGATVEVDSPGEGQGTVFTIRLPLAQT